MKTFKDTQSREWTINLTIGAAKRVKELLAVDLLKPHLPREGCQEQDSNGRRLPLATELYLDISLVVDVIYILIKPDLDAKNISDEDFASALGGESIKAAFNAFSLEWQNFFRESGRPNLAKVIEQNHIMLDKEITRNERMLDKAAELLTNRLDATEQAMLDDVKDICDGVILTNTRESSDKIPTATP